MKLSDYLEREDLTASAFAERAGVSVSVISRALSGVRQPGRSAAGKIVAATDGQVSYDDLWSDQEAAA